MSTHEYNDLFLKCQSNENALYHVFSFDIKASKKMGAKRREIARIKSLKFITLMYNKIYQIGFEQTKEILVFKSDYVHLGEAHINEFGYKLEPYILGDVVGLTVYRNSITKEEVMKVYEECITEVDIDFEFHIADGFYETDNWVEAREKYFRGHLLDVLSNLHKPCNRVLRKKLEQIKETKNNIK